MAILNTASSPIAPGALPVLAVTATGHPRPASAQDGRSASSSPAYDGLQASMHFVVMSLPAGTLIRARSESEAGSFCGAMIRIAGNPRGGTQRLNQGRQPQRRTRTPPAICRSANGTMHLTLPGEQALISLAIPERYWLPFDSSANVYDDHCDPAPPHRSGRTARS